MSKKAKLCIFTAVFTILLFFILIFFDEPQISFSMDSGFYQDNIELKINSTKGTVYYTTDGSVPTENSIKYDGPISLEPIYNGCHTIRAIAITGNRQSNIINGSYFIGKQICDKYGSGNVISIMANEDDLFGDNGITAFGDEYIKWLKNGKEGDEPTPNYYKRGKESEIPVVFELLSDRLSFSQNVGMRLAGSSTRTPDHFVKRYNLYARQEYSNSNVFDRKIFDGIRSHKLCIRESYGTAFIEKLTAKRNVSTQDSIPISLFINGKYYYDSYLMEKYDERYFIEHYNIHNDNLLLLKNGLEEEGNGHAYEEWLKLMDFVRNNDLSIDENYNQLCQMIDIQSYMDFMAINIYINNLDFDDTKNVIMWKSINKTNNKYEDCRWRFGLYDLDAFADDYWVVYLRYIYNLGVDDIYKINTFTHEVPYGQTTIENQTIFSALKANKKFCQQFINTFIEISDTCFDIDNIEKAMDEYGYDYFAYSFLQERKQYILDYLHEEFK